MIFTYQKIVFSVYNFFLSLNHVEVNMKTRFLINSGYYIVPSPSTALSDTLPIVELEYGFLTMSGEATNSEKSHERQFSSHNFPHE